MARNSNKTKQALRGVAVGTMAAIALAGIFLLGIPVYLLLNTSLTAARWWAGIATLIVVVGIPLAFLAGWYGARERMAGMDFALEKMTKAAGDVIDLRGQAAAAVRSATTKTANTPGFNPSDVVITRGKSAQQGPGEVVKL